jgi:heme/copper-type cytochrome/quinol oxidase subunit 1
VLVAGSMMGLFGGIYYYFPKITGRLLDEKIGNWHFWLFFIGVNLTFMPMHWSGLYGMPRRIYQYDAGQGWEIYNQMSTWGAYLQALSVLVGAYNILRSRKRGAVAGNDPWGAPSLEWSIPSPAPVYNFAAIPTVTSRYPLWDLKSPDLSRGTPHDITAEQHIEQPERVRSADELGIPLPYPTIKPLFVALFMTTMFASLLFIHKDKTPVAIVGIILSGIAMTAFLYTWLTAPLEPEHHH